MEYEDQEKIASFEFLSYPKVKTHFAALNMALLNGQHIQQIDDHLFELMGLYFSELEFYYSELYDLTLNRDRKDNQPYYYLSFPIEGKGKLSIKHRWKELNDLQTIIGLTLLNMYQKRHFDRSKEVVWEDIRQLILEEESSEDYKRILFKDVLEDYDDKEWGSCYKKFAKALKEFNKLGWVSLDYFPTHDANLDEIEQLRFTINVSINRLAELYNQEIVYFEQFIKAYQENKQKNT